MTLGKTWELDLKEISTTIPTMSSPTVASGRVYVGTSSNGLVCAGEPDVGRRPIWAGALGGPGRSGWIENIELSERGRFGWRLWDAESGGTGGEAVSITAAPAYLEDALYVGVNAKSRKGLVKLQVAKTQSGKPETRWFTPTTNAVVISAAVGDEAVYVADGACGDSDRALQCLDAKTGIPRWSREVDDEASGQFYITYDELWIADRADGFACLGLDGAEKHVYKTGPIAGVPLVLDDMVIVANVNDPELVALDRPTGRELWRGPSPCPPLSAPVLAGGRVWVAGAGGVTAHDVTNGRLVTSVACGTVATPLVADDTYLACVSDLGELLLIEVATGKTVRKEKSVKGAIPPVLAGKQLLYYDGKSIKRYEIGRRRGRSRSWFKLTSVLEAKLTSPMIVVDATVYAGTDTQGLICVKPPEKK